jgi:L-amino acid N-acyltransferase YncA
MTVRPAEPRDALAVAAIYAQGIAERVATFETEAPGREECEEWIRRPLMLVADEEDGGVAGWARVFPYSDRRVYDGVGEYTIYLDRAARGRGVGRGLLDALIAAAEAAGYYKLVGKLMAGNAASVALARRCGFREVGLHVNHGRLDGVWQDVLVVERLMGPARAGSWRARSAR